MIFLKERCEILISRGGMSANDLRDAGSGADIVVYYVASDSGSQFCFRG